MTTQRPSLAQRVADQYSTLLSVSRDLNNISDELGKYISELDSALKKLNLGVAVWVRVSIAQGPGETWFEEEEIGYAKADGRWGICLRKTVGDENDDPTEYREERWPFNDAPRRFRIEAIDHIPELVEKLSIEATKTTKEIRERLEDVKAVADAVKNAVHQPVRIRPRPKATETAVPSTTDPPTKLDVKVFQTIVADALLKSGHASASQILSTSQWSLQNDALQAVVPGIGPKMLALVLNFAAERIIGDELKRLGGPTKFIAIPGQPSTTAANAGTTAAAKGDK